MQEAGSLDTMRHLLHRATLGCLVYTGYIYIHSAALSGGQRVLTLCFLTLSSSNLIRKLNYFTSQSIKIILIFTYIFVDNIYLFLNRLGDLQKEAL